MVTCIPGPKMKSLTCDMLHWEEFLTVSLDFFFFNPLYFFKIRISLVHNVAINIKFCPVPWSLFVQGHCSLLTGSVLCWVEKIKSGRHFLIAASPVIINSCGMSVPCG